MATPSRDNQNAPVIEHNARAWDRLARDQVALARPAENSEFGEPLANVDPLGWLGGDISGCHVLCLAAGGGKHSALYAAAGAVVTVVDISGAMLALDRQVAADRELKIHAVQASMDDLSMLAAASFDIVIHPVSTCYVPNVQAVFQQVARVTKPKGVYVSQHKSPLSLQTDAQLQGHQYQIREPYYREGPLSQSERSRLREPGTLEFLHRLEEIVGGICRAGFTIEDFVEPLHADPQAEAGSFGHRCRYVAPYLRIKARRTTSGSEASGIELA